MILPKMVTVYVNNAYINNTLYSQDGKMEHRKDYLVIYQVLMNFFYLMTTDNSGKKNGGKSI